MRGGKHQCTIFLASEVNSVNSGKGDGIKLVSSSRVAVVNSQKAGERLLTTKISGAFRWLVVFVLTAANLIAIFLLPYQRLTFGRRTFDKLALLTPYATILLGVAVYLMIRGRKNIPLLLELFPFVGKLIARDKQNKQNLDEAIKLKNILQPYQLWKFDDDFTNELSESVPVDEYYIVGYYAKVIAGKLDPNAPDTLEQIVLLIYESTGTPRPDRWSMHKEMVAPRLALILLQSRQVAGVPSGLSLGSEELAQLLLKLDAFSKLSVHDVVNNFGLIWSYANNYLQFLSRNHIAPPDTTAPAEDLFTLIASKNLSSPRFDLDAVSFDVLVASGTPRLGKELGPDRELLVDSFVLISIALFVINVIYRRENKSQWQERACRSVAGIESAPLILLAYLEFVKEAEDDRAARADVTATNPSKAANEAGPVELKYLIEKWQEKNRELEKLPHVGYKRELSRIKNDLDNGKWPNELLYHIGETFAQAAKESPMNAIIEKNPWLQQTFKRVFAMVSPKTIKRFLRARTVSPYFITFSAGSWRVRPLLKDLEQKYNFKQYTDNVRIGVVPKQWSFERLCREFQRDFENLVEKQQEELPTDNPGDMELILHQFDLSPQNYYGFVKANVTKEGATERLRSLFGDMLSSEELLGMIEYQGDVPLAKMLIEAPISELIMSLGDFPQEATDTIEDRSSELQGILKNIVPLDQDPGIHDVIQHFLQVDPKKRDSIIGAAGEKLYHVLKQDIPTLNESRCREIIKNYFETMAAIASLDSPQIAARPGE